MENKKCLKPPTSYVCLYIYIYTPYPTLLNLPAECIVEGSGRKQMYICQALNLSPFYIISECIVGGSSKNILNQA